MSVGTDYGKNTSTVYQREQAEKDAAGSGKVTHGDFLKLLTKQLTSQDPLNPMQDIDFTAQLAQLQALDEQMAMTKAMTSLRADTQMQAGTAMIGKYVSGTDTAGNGASGMVMKIVQNSDGVFCELANKQRVPVGNINNVWNTANEMNNDLATSGQVIGMWVEAGYDKAAQPIRGIVSKVQVENGQVVLTLYGGQKVTWDQVTELRIPTEEESLYYLSDEIRTQIEDAIGMAYQTVTGKGTDGEEVRGIVNGYRLDEKNKVVLSLYGGKEIYLSEVTGDPESPNAEDAQVLKNYWVEGYNEDGEPVGGIVVGAVGEGEDLALILDDGTKLYYNALSKISTPDKDGNTATTEQKNRLHGMYAEGKSEGEDASGFIVKKLMVDGELAVKLSSGQVVLCKDLTLVREPKDADEEAASKEALEQEKANG